MNKSITQTNQAIRRYIELRDFEIIEDGWAYGKDAINYIARDHENGDLVFIATNIFRNDGEGIPETKSDRKSFERLAAAYLADADIDDCVIRFDIINLLVLSNGRGIVRHHRNALSEVG